MQNTIQASDNTMTAEELDRRLRILLPPEYEDRYEEVQPTSMGSAGLRYGADGRVAWDTIWDSFCDLAMAGGPPHRGKLLEPGRSCDIQENPDQYREVVAEICRGVRLLTGFIADAAPVAGWVRLYCSNEAMAGWLARAIAIENVSVYVQGSALCLPAAPSFRLEKEIKNVLTAIAKTSHYWMAHASLERHREIAKLLMRMDRESPLLQPSLQACEGSSDDQTASIHAVSAAIELATGLSCSTGNHPGWIGFDCGSTDMAIYAMRILIVRNILARREGTVVFAAHNATTDPGGEILIAGAKVASRR